MTARRIDFGDVSTCRSCRQPFVEYVYQYDLPDDDFVLNSSSHGFCKECRSTWIMPPKTQRSQDSRVYSGADWSARNLDKADWPKRKFVQYYDLNCVLDRLPVNCRGAILRRIIQAQPVLMRKSELVSSVTGYRRVVVRNEVNRLIGNGVLEQTLDPPGIGVPFVVLSAGAAVSYGLQVYQSGKWKGDPGNLAEAFPNYRSRWVFAPDNFKDRDKILLADDIPPANKPQHAERPEKPPMQDGRPVVPRDRVKLLACLRTIQERFLERKSKPAPTCRELQDMHQCESRTIPRNAYRLFWDTPEHKKYQQRTKTKWGRSRGRPANSK
jgi:hypothetical protein